MIHVAATVGADQFLNARPWQSSAGKEGLSASRNKASFVLHVRMGTSCCVLDPSARWLRWRHPSFHQKMRSICCDFRVVAACASFPQDYLVFSMIYRGSTKGAPPPPVDFCFARCVCTGSNNIMYPKENKADRKLVYACNRCSYKEDAQSGSCVYRNNLITTAG